MSVEAVVGANWGDEGKGKIIDFLAGKADMVHPPPRCQDLPAWGRVCRLAPLRT